MKHVATFEPISICGLPGWWVSCTCGWRDHATDLRIVRGSFRLHAAQRTVELSDVPRDDYTGVPLELA